MLLDQHVDITEEEHDRMFVINAKSAIFCMQEAAKRMANNVRIINMETSLVRATTHYYSAYAGSKDPLEDFTRALAKEIGNRGVTVNNLTPGLLNTSFFYPAETPESTEFFGSSIAYLASIDKVENGGLTIYGKFHSDQWGDFKIFMRFNMENDKITKLEVGQTE